VGAFYESLAARAPRPRVLEAVATGYAAALVGPTRQGWTVAAPDSDGRLDDHLTPVAVELSQDGPVVCTTVHDDDDLLLQVYDGGRLVATYDSDPGYLEGTPQSPDVSELDALAAALGVHDVGPLRAVLTGRYALETDRLADAAPLLGLPSYVVLFGYDYAVDGDLPAGLAPDELEPVTGR
jgi:hypothetical protein